MKTAKISIGITIMLLLLSGVEVHAQLGGLFEKAKEKASKAIEKKVDKNTVSTKPKAIISSGNSNIVIGDSAMLTEDFSAFETGATATSFKTNGVAGIVTINGQKGKWMDIKDKAIYKFSRQLNYPKQFTLSFDIIAIADQIKDIAPMSFGFASDNSVRQHESNIGTYVQLHYYDTDQVNIGSNKPEKFVGTTFDLAPWLDRPLHVVLSVNGEQMAVYLNNIKLADTVLFSPGAAKNFYISAPWQYDNGAKVLVSNFQVAGFKK
ncbi:hypothetical protein SAMN05421827_101578 [Pedobacter terrae]|uniref:Concanavalin A-like lectin/glucanase superfamily protein n=1 Tax=Pedobacter terrae TaxID=405671 RepID=A0A1G7P036_9SPHI|nr:hypothetical protein [Pedobacter terrae]SDF79603.1 hypothetical protein SAMN05421827_101578 [Pedobacter terrae]